jgi:four helix bundle protein
MPGAIAPGMVRGHHAQRRLVWQLSDQLRLEIFKLTRREPLDGDTKLRLHLHDAVAAICRNVAEAFGCDRHRDFGRFVRLARAAVADLQDGLQRALMKRAVVETDVAAAREVIARLYPALASLLASY